MARITFDTAPVAATPAHDLGVWYMEVPDDEVMTKVKALHDLGFDPEVTL